jgi:hypothetical protein
MVVLLFVAPATIPLLAQFFKNKGIGGMAGGICAVAYLIAWMIMKALVPKYRKIED